MPLEIRFFLELNQNDSDTTQVARGWGPRTGIPTITNMQMVVELLEFPSYSPCRSVEGRTL